MLLCNVRLTLVLIFLTTSLEIFYLIGSQLILHLRKLLFFSVYVI